METMHAVCDSPLPGLSLNWKINERIETTPVEEPKCGTGNRKHKVQHDVMKSTAPKNQRSHNQRRFRCVSLEMPEPTLDGEWSPAAVCPEILS